MLLYIICVCLLRKITLFYLLCIKGIVVQRSDLVGLIMRRNELASDILKALTLQQLPPMLQVCTFPFCYIMYLQLMGLVFHTFIFELQSPSICRGCRHVNVCSIYHKVLLLPCGQEQFS